MTHRLFQVGAVSEMETGRLTRITREGTEYKYYVLNSYKLSYRFNNGEEKNITVPEEFCLRGPKGTPFPYPSAAWVFKEWIYCNQAFDGGRAIHRRMGDNIVASILISEKRSQVKSRWWGGDRSSNGAADWRRARKTGPVYSGNLFTDKGEEETAPKTNGKTEQAAEPSNPATEPAEAAEPAKPASKAPAATTEAPAEKAAPAKTAPEAAKTAPEAAKPAPAAATETKAEPAKTAAKPAEKKAPAKKSAAPAEAK